jgi:hypothetical protein
MLCPGLLQVEWQLDMYNFLNIHALGTDLTHANYTYDTLRNQINLAFKSWRTFVQEQLCEVKVPNANTFNTGDPCHVPKIFR